MLKIFLTLLALLVVIYVCFGFSLFVNQSRFIFFPDRTVFATPEQIGLAYRSVTFLATDHVKLNGWLIPADNAHGIILFCHGNGGSISNLLETVAIFHKLGFSCFVFDYRGYGQSEGTPSEAGTYLDGQAAWDYLVNIEHIAPSDIIVFGRSLGASIAARLSSRYTPRASVLESGFTSIKDMAEAIYPFFPTSLICRFQYNTQSDVKKITCPLLIIHSDEDDVVPFSHGCSLFASARDPKTFLRTKGNHNNGFLTSGHLYTEGLRKFFEETK